MYKKIILSSSLLLLSIQPNVYAEKNNDLITSVNKNTQKYASNQFTQMEVHKNKIKSQNSSLAGFEKIAENKKLELYVNSESLAIKVKNKSNGYIWSSTVDHMEKYKLNSTWEQFVESAITIEYLNIQGKLRKESITTHSAKINLKKKANGFDANITFGQAKIKMKLSVELAKDEVIVSIPEASIIEMGKVKLVSANVYPFFGASKENEIPGYLFIPDGSGALIRYEKNGVKMESPYSATVYGEDKGISFATQSEDTNESYRASIPVFGVVHGEHQNALLGIIEDGDNYARIDAYKAGLSTEFNWVTSNFTYRYAYKQPTSKNQKSGKALDLFQKKRNNFDIKLHYRILENDHANYVGMAKSYQSYLVNNGVLKKKTNDSPMLRLEFLGGEKKEGLFWDSVVSMTPISNLPKYANELVRNGVDDFFIVYKGWNKNGLTGTFPKKFPFERKLGSKGEVNETVKELKKKDVPLYFYTDYVKAYEGSSSLFGGGNIAKQVNTKAILDEENGYNYYYLHPEKAISYAKKDKKEYKKYSMENLAVDSNGSELYSAFNDRHTASREESKQSHNKVLSILNSGDVDKTALYQPNVYAWGMTDKYLDIPMGSSNYLYVSDTVPFLQIVLKGYVDYYAPFSNFWSNQKEELLRLIDYGAYPSFYLTGNNSYLLSETPSRDLYTSEYKAWKSEIVNQYGVIQKSLKLVKNESIMSREVLSEGVVKVTYSNNSSFIINYTNMPFKSGSLTVAAKDFAVMKGETSNE
ncbi:DUF5696 domain-containing protein [Bacillus sp. AFS055030]|uniref:DUF5696 domain-containing protein n=1 Tax=Bacillus sp. AFS055030 TaxID=2033507 RepID=UPI000BFD0AEA|nr:DUF5696 domain-containing protein [Bacillus sp. AFS055030]PGL70098.1 hypothetical protein CN925_12975 [Bacillus sp. AFS055030]